LQTTRNAAFKAAMLASGAGVIAMAQPAFAQANATPAPAPAAASTPTCDPAIDPTCATPNAPSQGIVVTGSRIVKKDYNSNSPLVTADQGLLNNSSTSSLEQNLNKLPQFEPAKTPVGINAGDIQPTATNTPGAATVDLRGIGSNRSLVLIDGRRATPGNASGVVDINTIPSAAVERVEIISGGASATYGADAVAGVTNFILKKNFQGVQLDGRVGIDQHGNGFNYDISGVIGSDFADGRGNVSLAMSTNKREATFNRDLKWYRDLWTNPNVGGSGFFIPAPGFSTGFSNLPSADALAAVFPGASPSIPAAGTNIYFNNGVAFTGDTFQTRGGTAFFTGATDGRPYKKTAAGTIAANDDYLYAQLPLNRYNMLMRGNYEINDWIGVFGQGMFSHVHTHTVQEPGPIVNGWDVFIDPTKLDQDQLPQQMWDLLNSRTHPAGPTDPGYIAPTPANPNPLQPMVSGANLPFQMHALLPFPRENDTNVDTFNLTAGFQGSIPGSDWTWEAFASHGESSTYAIQTGIASLSRIRAVMDSGNFGRGFSAKGNAIDGGFGASTATCTSGLNFFKPPAGGFSQDCLDAINANLQNRVKMKQSIWEANATGSLFDLPAGPLQAAVGLSYRRQDFTFFNDTLTTQGESFQDQALGIYPSGNAAGHINVKELYGELSIPIIKDSFIRELSLELGGRISDYNTTGTSYTYKALANFAPTDWIRFRGGYNRAERAPNIGELYLAAQQTFGVNTAGDPCSLANPLSFSANPANANGAAVLAVCKTLMDQTGSATAKDLYYAGVQSNSTFGFAFPTLVGNASLVPEKADTWTAGVVLSSPFKSAALSRLRLSVDWYRISVKHAIGPQTVAIALQQCFDPSLNPLVTGSTYGAGGPNAQAIAAANSPFCQLVPRNQTGQLGNVQITYVNNGRFETSGIDAQLDWSAEVGPGTLSANVLFNYLIDFKSAPLPTLPMVDYRGTQGTPENGLNEAAYDYRLFATLGYHWGPATLGLQWQHLPSIKNSSFATFPATTTTGAPSYDLFSLNGSYAVTDNVTLRAGVDNLFNKAPPLTGVNTANTNPAANGLLPGGSFNAQYYDVLGRRFYIGANMKF
jgi:outer membrane receptor protein involved in Fe transport